MLSITWNSPHKGEFETLELTKDPKFYGLGYYEDTNGTMWDVKVIRGCKGGTYVINARPVDNSPYYSTANDSHSFGFHSWNPYFYIVIEKQEKNGSKEK